MITAIQIYARDLEQTAEDAAPSSFSVLETACPMRKRTGTTSEQLIENEDEDKSKVVLPKLYLDSITKMVIDQATHEFASQVPCLGFQIHEQYTREYIDQVVQGCLHDNDEWPHRASKPSWYGPKHIRPTHRFLW